MYVISIKNNNRYNKFTEIKVYINVEIVKIFLFLLKGKWQQFIGKYD